MLTIGRVGRGASAQQYYVRLHEEDYYLRKGSGEPPGQWVGRLVEPLGLRGVVGEKEFRKLFDGESPTGLALRQRRPNERPAFDLTYSVSKDVSTVYAIADPELKRKIEAAIYAAVKEAMRYIEDDACMTRLGKNGTEVERGGGIAAALFLHCISRELDPQLHIHAVVFNFTEGPDGKYRTLDASKFYDHCHTAGALFRTDLAARLEKLGFEIERDRFSFAIKGVPPSLKEEFSKRAEQIRRELGEEEATPKQKDGAALESREPKRDVDRDALLAEWREVAKRHGLTAERVNELRSQKGVERDETAELQAAVCEALKEITSRESSFTPRKLLEQAAIEGQTRGLGANEIRRGVGAELELARRGKSQHVVHLGQHRDRYERFTTREFYELEQDIIQTGERGRQSREHCVSDTALAAALAAKPTLRAEQVKAVGHITQEAGRVQCVSGWAGSGKTFMLDAARLAWEADGYTVYGSALSGKAAEELSKGANIKSATIAKWIYDLDHPERKERLALDSKSILVIDEAGMVGSRQLHRLITEVERAGARLVLVGDDKQLQSIDAGGGFSGLSKRLGYVELKEITRQRHAADRQAVYDLAEGRAAPALRSYAKRGRLILGESRADAMQRLVADWRSDTTEIEEKLILSSTNHQAATLNRLCQQERERRGELGQDSITVRDGAEVHAGDRVLFTRNDKWVGVHNGDLATVIKVTTADENARRPRESVTVKLDSGKLLTVVPSRYDRKNMTLGYCVTTHKAQGATVESTYVFSYGAMTDAEMAYVQASRAREKTRIYTTKDEAGPELSDLAEAMSRSRKKAMAHDAIEGGVKPTRGARPRRLRHKL